MVVPSYAAQISFAHDHPDRVNDAGNVTAKREQDIQPEMEAKSDLEKHANRRKNDGDENTKDIHDGKLSI